ncbi:hypothetical protein AC579_2488, partial [Pseudocercospora musae]
MFMADMNRSGQRPSLPPMPALPGFAPVPYRAPDRYLHVIQSGAQPTSLMNWPQPAHSQPIGPLQVYHQIRQQPHELQHNAMPVAAESTNRYPQPPKAKKPKVQPPKANIPSSLISDLAKARQEASTLTDFTITWGDRKWNVHRLVLHLNSSVLRKACSGAFKESQTKELDLSGDPEDAVEALIDYMYRFDYEIPDLPSGEVSSELAFHVLVVVIADKYNMKSFQDLATAKFRAIAESIGVNDQDLTEAATIAYAAQLPTSEIRKIIATTAFSKPDYFMPEEPATSAFGTYMESEPALAIDIARASLSRKSEATDHR